MCPRWRSGAVGSKPTLTFSGRPVRDALAQLFLADDLDEALLQVRDLFLNRMQGHLIIVAVKPASRGSSAR